jgi:diguanylate cyclase (GGDEF)-like protein
LTSVATVIAFMAVHPRWYEPWVGGVAIFILFLVANVAVLHFVVRQQAFSVSVTELPLVLGLYFVSPPLVIVASALAMLISQWKLRTGATKLWFNTAKSAIAASVACVVVEVFGPVQSLTPSSAATLFGAASLSWLITLIAVAGVISIMQGRLAGLEVVRTALPAVITVAVNVAIALVLIAAIAATRWSLLPMAILAGTVVLGYRSYSEFFRQHRTLADVYELTSIAGQAGRDGLLPDAILRRVRSLLNAEFATLWLPAQGRHPEVLLTACVDADGLLDISRTPVVVRERAMARRASVAAGPRLPDNVDLRPDLRRSGVKDVVVAPLKSGGAPIGLLEVVNRLGDQRFFRDTDVQVLGTIAAHAAVAVENSRLVDRLRYDAYHDRLTDLPNRRRMVEALLASMKVDAPDDVVAVMLFDVNGLRDVNESMGREAGDKLLVEVAERLRAGARPGALVGRIGGDEFVVTLRAESAEAAVALAVELRDQLRIPMIFGSLTLDVGTAVGVAVHPEHGDEPEVLLQRADLAATAAKLLPSGVQPFHPALESRAVRRLGLAGDLRKALDDGTLEVYFQPKVTLEDRRLVGVECLARWNHPVHGMVAPQDFVAVAEHTGQLGRLTEVVLRDGLRRCRDWADQDRPLSIAVNLSGRTLADPLFPDLVEQLVIEYGVAPAQVTFELAEPGEGGELERALPVLNRLRELGVRLSVDDFGTGASSLSYLRRLGVHEVKIDGSCVQGMVTDPGDLAIVRAVIGLAREFGLTVVAEGVESERTLEMLEELGCGIGQGYLFSRPLPYERLETWFGAQTEAESTPAGEVRRLRAVP